MVDVSSSKNSITITVGNTNKNNPVSITPGTANNSVTTKSDTAQYWSNLSRDYSEQAKTSAYKAEQVKNEIITQKDIIIADIENTGVNAVGNITTARDESIASVEAKTNEASELVDAGIANINTVKNEAIDNINSTKTTILNDIEFVADGEKEEIRELVDTGKNEIQELTNEIKDNAEDIINRVGLNMFDTILKDHLLTYEESKGLALQGTYVYKDAIAGERYGYPDFYAKCLEEYNEATATETVNGVTVKVHSNGHKFYDIANKTAIDGFFNTMGTAWFYGVDTAEERIFLPRNNFFEQMTGNVAEVGDSVQAGLPNITGGYSNSSRAELYGADINLYGAFAKGASSSKAASTSSGGPGYGFTFDASRSSSIYGNSNTVQPNAVKKLLYICVGNTVADTSWVEVVTQVEGGVKDLEDKTNEGLEALANASNALRETQITNCIKEIPQRIKLELNAEKSLVLKTGSEYIVPNGFEDDGVTPRFDYVTTDIDIQQGNGHAAQDLYFVRNYSSPKYLIGYQATKCFSGNTAPTGFGTYAFWYDTANNLVKWTSDSGATWTSGYSLPVCLTTGSSNTVITSIDQVFNGMGYIGSTIWIDKGVKGLIPNGRNEDGSLKNIEFVTDKILMGNYSTNLSATVYVGVNNSIVGFGYYYLDDENNVIRTTTDTNTRQLCIIGSTTVTASNLITSFSPKQPFRAVDYNDKQEIISWCMPDYSAGIAVIQSSTTFTAPCAGVFMGSPQLRTSDSAYVDVFVNDVLIYRLSTSDTVYQSHDIMILLDKDDILRLSKQPPASTYNYFYPLKGAN